MVVEKNNNTISGSNALKSNVAVEKKVRHQNPDKNNRGKVDKQRIVKNKLCFIRNMAIGFVVITAVLFRYSIIYNNQIKINNIKTEIHNVKAENESMKVQLLKLNNLSYIEDIAINKLKMVKPDAQKAMYVGLTNVIDNNAEKPSSKSDTNKSNSNSIISKIKKILF
ncbi:FtsB family cell division protein [Clostridium ihumii]|uniref:FtsB family cell division protein n=1 Tax=Clostridium ihumii TaxID=1470356 RepID=UPI00068876F4|nr:hypothetical protein [Clostridium ihumii]